MERWFPVETERLTLREYALADEAAVHAYACDPIVSRYDTWGPNSAEQTREHFERRMAEQRQWPRDDVTLLAELRRERKAIGSVRLWVVDGSNRTAAIGYTFNRLYWNSGFATEAARALLECAFGTLNMHRVIATCDTRNGASWRVMEKLGMRREAEFIRDEFQKGEWRNTYLYALLHDEWQGGGREG